MKYKEEIAMAFEVVGSCMGSIELEQLGKRYGLNGKNIDLQVGIIVKKLDVERCSTCNWWVNEPELYNDVCSCCYAIDDDE